MKETEIERAREVVQGDKSQTDLDPEATLRVGWKAMPPGVKVITALIVLSPVASVIRWSTPVETSIGWIGPPFDIASLVISVTWLALALYGTWTRRGWAWWLLMITTAVGLINLAFAPSSWAGGRLAHILLDVSSFVVSLAIIVYLMTPQAYDWYMKRFA